MKILVTGAAGFIGSHIAHTLKVDGQHAMRLGAKKGHEVMGIDRLLRNYSTERKRRTIAMLKDDGVDVRICDLSAVGLGFHLPKDLDVVVHCAAQPGITDQAEMHEYIANNIWATYYLLEELKKQEKPPWFVFLSTSSVYGADASRIEDKAPAPISRYGVTKLAAEQLVLSYARRGNLLACALRLFSVYGPRERPEKLISGLFESILDERPFKLHEGSRKHVRAFTYVTDVAWAIQCVLEAEPSRWVGEVYNIGCEISSSVEHVIRTVEKVAGRRLEIETVPARVGDQLMTRARAGKALHVLGWEAETPLGRGLEQTWQWHKWYRKEYGEGKKR